MKPYIITLWYEIAVPGVAVADGKAWKPKLKKFITIGRTLEEAATQLLDAFREHNHLLGRTQNIRAVDAAEIDAEIVLPEMQLPFIPTA